MKGGRSVEDSRRNSSGSNGLLPQRRAVATTMGMNNLKARFGLFLQHRIVTHAVHSEWRVPCTLLKCPTPNRNIKKKQLPCTLLKCPTVLATNSIFALRLRCNCASKLRMSHSFSCSSFANDSLLSCRSRMARPVSRRSFAENGLRYGVSHKNRLYGSRFRVRFKVSLLRWLLLFSFRSSFCCRVIICVAHFLSGLHSA